MQILHTLIHAVVVVKSSKTAHTKSNKNPESRLTILWISSTESATNFKADENHVKRWDCSSHFFPQFAQTEHAAILLGQNQRWIQAGPHGADPASGSTKATASLLPAINCFSSGGHRKRKAQQWCTPCAFAWLCFTRTRGGRKEASCSRRLAMFAARLNFSLDRCKAREMMCLVIISIMSSFVFCKLS